MTDGEKQQLHDLVEKSAAALSEHFDSVRIFVTKPSEDGKQSTFYCSSGTGNFYAQLGHVQQWLAIQDQLARDSMTEEPE